MPTLPSKSRTVGQRPSPGSGSNTDCSQDGRAPAARARSPPAGEASTPSAAIPELVAGPPPVGPGRSPGRAPGPAARPAVAARSADAGAHQSVTASGRAAPVRLRRRRSRRGSRPAVGPGRPGLDGALGRSRPARRSGGARAGTARHGEASSMVSRSRSGGSQPRCAGRARPAAAPGRPPVSMVLMGMPVEHAGSRRGAGRCTTSRRRAPGPSTASSPGLRRSAPGRRRAGRRSPGACPCRSAARARRPRPRLRPAASRRSDHLGDDLEARRQPRPRAPSRASDQPVGAAAGHRLQRVGQGGLGDVGGLLRACTAGTAGSSPGPARGSLAMTSTCTPWRRSGSATARRLGTMG